MVEQFETENLFHLIQSMAINMNLEPEQHHKTKNKHGFMHPPIKQHLLPNDRDFQDNSLDAMNAEHLIK